ncbi:MAG: S41 family peptidase [Kiritimatiellae bacterium]|nr:S41 family peptidase [Kiritimatiellia bacterium]MDD4734735.1 S41 family peptidase [Kiritimatiellia bacterium]
MHKAFWCLLVGSVVMPAVVFGTVAPVGSAAGSLERGLDEVVSVFNERALHVDEPLMLGGAVEGMLKAVDPNGAFLTQQALEEMTHKRNGTFYSAGVRLCFTGEAVTVEALIPGSPAEQAGLLPGDGIVRVKDQALDGLIPPEIISLFRGEGPDEVEVVFLRGGEEHTATFQLAPVQLSSVEFVEYFPEDLVYVRLNGFFASSGGELPSLLKAWKEQRKFGVILDLRNASGSDMDSVNILANALAPPRSRLYGFQDKSGRWLQEVISDESERLSLPMMVLVNGETSEASELLAAVCKNALRGCMVLGAETSGAPMVREAVPLSDGRMLYLATRLLVAGEKGRYDGRQGVQPDITVSDDWYAGGYEPELTVSLLEEEKEDKALRERVRGDGPLSRATDLLLGLKALNLQAVGTP